MHDRIQGDPVGRRFLRLAVFALCWGTAAVAGDFPRLPLGSEAPSAPSRVELRVERTFVAPTLADPLPASSSEESPRNLILGDGMGPNALKLTSLNQHQAEGRLVMEQLPVAGPCPTPALTRPTPPLPPGNRSRSQSPPGGALRKRQYGDRFPLCLS